MHAIIWGERFNSDYRAGSVQDLSQVVQIPKGQLNLTKSGHGAVIEFVHAIEAIVMQVKGPA